MEVESSVGRHHGNRGAGGEDGDLDQGGGRRDDK